TRQRAQEALVTTREVAMLDVAVWVHEPNPRADAETEECVARGNASRVEEQMDSHVASVQRREGLLRAVDDVVPAYDHALNAVVERFRDESAVERHDPTG